jgi:hypothetical protein
MICGQEPNIHRIKNPTETRVSIKTTSKSASCWLQQLQYQLQHQDTNHI